MEMPVPVADRVTEPIHMDTGTGVGDKEAEAERIEEVVDPAKVEEELVNKTAQENKARLRKGMLHSSRLGTFIVGGWPVERDTTETVRCTPHELALAGLEYVSEGSAQCCVCWRLISNLEPSSDPWECHRIANPNCALIKLGKPAVPDGFTLEQFLNLLTERQVNYMELGCNELDEYVESTMEEFVNQELADCDEDMDDTF